MWEWCADGYAPYSGENRTDPCVTDKQFDDYRVLRGGSWASRPPHRRAAFRSGGAHRGPWLGHQFPDRVPPGLSHPECGGDGGRRAGVGQPRRRHSLTEWVLQEQVNPAAVSARAQPARAAGQSGNPRGAGGPGSRTRRVFTRGVGVHGTTAVGTASGRVFGDVFRRANFFFCTRGAVLGQYGGMNRVLNRLCERLTDARSATDRQLLERFLTGARRIRVRRTRASRVVPDRSGGARAGAN